MKTAERWTSAIKASRSKLKCNEHGNRTLNRINLPRRVTELPRVGSRGTDEQIDRIRADGREILHLSAYPDRKIPREILEAAWAEADTLEHPPARGMIGLREALAQYLEQRGGRPSDPNAEILITCGAMHALLISVMSIVDPGDEVLLFTPSYFFQGTIELAGARMTSVPLREENGFAWRPDELEKAITPKTRAILLNTPTNPTGVVASRECLEEIAEIAERHDLFIVCDESYDQLVYDGLSHRSILSVNANRSRNILVGSFTKSFAMAPWRVGYIVTSAEVAEAALKVLEWSCLFGPYLNQRVAELVMRSDRAWLTGVPEEFQSNRDRLAAELGARNDLSFVMPQGNPFLFLNVSHYGSDDCEIAGKLLERAGIPCTPGTLHGAPGYVRIPFGGSPTLVSEAGRRIVKVLGESS